MSKNKETLGIDEEALQRALDASIIGTLEIQETNYNTVLATTAKNNSEVIKLLVELMEEDISDEASKNLMSIAAKLQYNQSIMLQLSDHLRKETAVLEAKYETMH